MADTKELKKIKKIYGEKFKNLCRDMFPDIIEQEGTLLSILEKTFSHNCISLYEDITECHLENDFKKLIYAKFAPKQERNTEEQNEDRNPYEILADAGYELIECKTEEDIQKFRDFYAPNEVLCTIYNGGRLATRYCFFAVKKNVAEIRRENFTKPDKEDEYSTSVLGIQFTKTKPCTVQIISRYNHTIGNPNCTLENKLDNLKPGLEQSFTKLLKERGLDFDSSQSEQNSKIPGYTVANDGKYYKYNKEINGVHYCPKNIVIWGGKVLEFYGAIVIDNFCVDIGDKKIEFLDTSLSDPFVDYFKNKDIKKISVEKATEHDGRIIKVYLDEKEKPVIIGINKNNQMVSYENPYIQQIGDNFLRHNTTLTKLSLPELKKVGNWFLFHNIVLSTLYAPKLQQVGDYFLSHDYALTKLDLPELKKNGEGFAPRYCSRLIEVNIPNIPELEKELRKVASKNLSRITPTDIALLDKNSSLTTSEVKNAGSLIEKTLKPLSDEHEEKE